MSLLRQIALALVLVAGTALAVNAYLDTQHGSLHSDGEAAAPILEFGASYPMTRPLRASHRPIARDSRAMEAGGSLRSLSLQGGSDPSARCESGGGVSSIEDIKPVSASYTREEEADQCLPPSAAGLPMTN